MEKLKQKIDLIKKYSIVSSGIAVFILSLLFISPAKSEAQASICPLSGWAWSGYSRQLFGGWTVWEGVGWVSFSGNISGSSGTYEVAADQNGWLNGYAWSENIGWVRFGGLSGFPTTGGVVSNNVRIEINNELTGWARACAVFASGCSGALAPDYYRGGWDGWIALRGSASGVSYGVTSNPQNGELSGWAWGGPIVGWLSFRDTNYGVTLASGNQCVTGGGNFDYSITANTVLIDPPSGAGTVTAGSILVINRLRGAPEDVEITGIALPPNYQLPTGITSVGNFRGVGLVCPNASCALQISADVTFGSNYVPNPSNNQIRLIVSVDNTATSNPPEEKDTDFYITINPGNNNVACSVSPATALIDQEVTWRAPSNDPTFTYRWFYENSLPNQSFGIGSTFEITYPTLGLRTGYVETCDGTGNCETSDICSVRIIPIPVFQQR